MPNCNLRTIYPAPQVHHPKSIPLSLIHCLRPPLLLVIPMMSLALAPFQNMRDSTLSSLATLVIYHPFAQHPPEVIDTAKLTLTWESSLPPPSEDPYTLFSTCDDFEQAEIFICHNCTNMMINNQLQLNQKAPQAGEQCPQSMKNACEMHKILAEAGEYQDTSLVILLHHLHRFMVLMPKCSLQVWRYLSHIHMAMRRTGPILCTVIQQWKQYWMPLKILIFTHHSYSILNGTIS